MLGPPVGTLDRFLAGAMLARARHTWPVLRLVPTAICRPLLMPAAIRVRRALTLAALLASLLSLFAGLLIESLS